MLLLEHTQLWSGDCNSAPFHHAVDYFPLITRPTLLNVFNTYMFTNFKFSKYYDSNLCNPGTEWHLKCYEIRMCGKTGVVFVSVRCCLSVRQTIWRTRFKGLPVSPCYSAQFACFNAAPDANHEGLDNELRRWIRCAEHPWDRIHLCWKTDLQESPQLFYKRWLHSHAAWFLFPSNL